MNATSNTDRQLTTASAFYAACFVLHNADHARRGIAATPEPVVWAGTFVAMLSAVLITLVVVRHRRSAMFCAVGGAAIAVGVSLTHLLPKWGVLSDPVLTNANDAVTRIAVVSEIVGAAVLAVVGLRSARKSLTHRGTLQAAPR